MLSNDLTFSKIMKAKKYYFPQGILWKNIWNIFADLTPFVPVKNTSNGRWPPDIFWKCLLHPLGLHLRIPPRPFCFALTESGRPFQTLPTSRDLIRLGVSWQQKLKIMKAKNYHFYEKKKNTSHQNPVPLRRNSPIIVHEANFLTS